jgi:hypothetical protein
MMVKRRGLSIILIPALFLGALSSPVSASELSDAETRYSDLRRTYEANLNSVNVLIPGYESESQQCINRFVGSTNSEDIESRERCQVALSRFQVDKEFLKKQIDELKIEMTSLEKQIQSLRSASSTTPSVGSSTPTSSAEPSVSQASPTPTASQSSEDQSQPSTAAPTPTPIQNSESRPATSAPTPSSSPLPTAVSGSKASATPKPVVKKKKTILCVKGKVTRKVTAAKPVCPKGFKVKKK